MTTTTATMPRSGVRHLVDSRAFWVAVPAVIAAVLYLSTVQLHINGSNHPFATDVGEIQNALPRWGTIHHSSYPLYTFAGSLFVTILGGFGIAPAAGVSLYSAVFGVVTVALVAWLALELDIPGPAAALGATAVAVATSVWVDASIAEVHTVTMAFTLAALIFAVRLGRDGRKADLYWLTLFMTQGVAHQRSVIVIAPAVLVLIWPHVRLIFHHILPVLGITLLAPLTYLYLPITVWAGSDWIFGAPHTWDGFWTLFFDNRGGRVFDATTSAAEWMERTRITLAILADDLFWPLQVAGLAALVLMIFDRPRRRAGIALTLAWIPNFLLTVVIWRNRVVDAQLAAKLPILLIAGIGIAYLVYWVATRNRTAGTLTAALILVILGGWVWQTRPFVLSITRDRSVEPIIADVDRLRPFDDGRFTTVTMPWGRDFWGLTYAQAFRGQLQGLTLVDHNATFRDIVGRGDHLLAHLATFYVFPLQWWEELLGGPVYLSTGAPAVIELNVQPPVDASTVPADVDFDLQNGARVRHTAVEWIAPDQLLLTIYWEARAPVDGDYSVAVHLVAQDPPAGPGDLLAQADNAHPVEGLYPTTRWQPGEVVRDHYLLSLPANGTPTAIRVGMYRPNPDGGFVNSPWLSLPLPPDRPAPAQEP